MGLRGSRSTPVVLAALGVLLFAAAPAAAAPGNLTFLQHDTGATLSGARGVTVSPDGKSVYVAGQNADTLVTYSRNLTTGALTNTGCFKDAGGSGCAATAEGLNSARFVAVSPDNEHVYVTGGDESAVAIFDRNPTTGALTSIGCAEGSDAPGGTACTTALGTPLDGAEGIAVSTNGAQVYVAAQDVNSLATLTRTPATGALAFAAATNTNLFNPRELAVSPDGKGVYVASASGSIAAFLRNTGTGALTGAGTGTGVSLPVGVTVSPDSKHVYAGAVNSDAVRVYTRNTSTSVLTAAGCLKDTASATAGCTNAEGLDGVEGVAVSPDGANVYAAGAVDDAVVSMTRTPLTGAVGALGCLRDSPGGGGCGVASGLNGAHGVAVSPDGRNVYVTGFDDTALAVFTRSTGGGPAPPPPPPPPPCTNPATILVSCAPPQVCGPTQSILPQCYFPTVFPTVCGPSNSLLPACGPGQNYVTACGGMGTILPACALPPPQIPQVCGPSNTILPPCTGANNPILVCGPANTVLPECNFGFKPDPKPITPGGSAEIPIELSCPPVSALSRAGGGATAAQNRNKPKTCTIDAALEALSTGLLAVLDSQAESDAGAHHRWVRGGNNHLVFRTRAHRVARQFLSPGTTRVFSTEAIFEELTRQPCCPPYGIDDQGFYASGSTGARDPGTPEAIRAWIASLARAVQEYRKLERSTGGRSSSSSRATAARLKKPRASKRFKIKVRKGKKRRRRTRVKLKLSRKTVRALTKQARKSRSKRAVPVRLIVSYRVKGRRPVARVIDFQLKVKKAKPKRRKRKG